MCGISGLYDSKRQSEPDALRAAAERMAAALIHRGPDDFGTFVDAASGLALAHRRLSIIDLSPAGHQPMTSASGRFIVVFNGELYNHLALRRELPEVAWRGHSDTETLLAALEAWGLEAALEKSVGMFAIAVWDRHSRELALARDRLGEKPLYYGWAGDTFIFASELKALRAHPSFAGEIDRDALALLLRHNNIGAPHSIYRGVRKLTPGSIVRINVRTPPKTLPQPAVYWSLAAAAATGQADPLRMADDESVRLLEAQLVEAIRLQRVADVPLGAFLSGGIDSSTIVALMQAQSDRPIKTFTIGFEEPAYDESAQARAVARYLGTDHTELRVTAREARDVIPTLPIIYDEPFGDSSAIPTVLVARLARRHVTVALSGDAGDELFCGYTRYPRTTQQWGRVCRIPELARRVVARAGPFVSRHRQRTLTEAMRCRNDVEFFRTMTSQWQMPDRIVKGAREPRLERGSADALGSAPERMMLADGLTYLPDDILVKVDRAAMACSLETRVPFLDHRVVELAWRLPLTLKLRGNESKWALRRILEKYVPRALTERPKVGFGVPLDEWLRGPLREWAEDLLAESRLRREGFLEPVPIRACWREHLSGHSNLRDPLWGVLMFQAWLAGRTA